MWGCGDVKMWGCLHFCDETGCCLVDLLVEQSKDSKHRSESHRDRDSSQVPNAVCRTVPCKMPRAL